MSCKKDNLLCECIERTGDIITEQRALSGFNELLIYDNANIFITQDTVFSVTVQGGKNMLPLITTEVKDSTLEIHNNNRCNWTRSYNKPLNIYITMPELNNMIYRGSGKITSLNALTTSVINVESFGTGDIELTLNNYILLSHVNNLGNLILHGTTSGHSCSIAGNAFLYGQDMISTYTWIHTFSTGICYVTVNGTIDCEIENIGDIHCYGNSTSRLYIDHSQQGKLYLNK